MRADHEKNSGRWSIISIGGRGRDANTARGGEKERGPARTRSTACHCSYELLFILRARTIGSFMRFYKHSASRESLVFSESSYLWEREQAVLVFLIEKSENSLIFA